jgi:hypothetical protein
MAVSFPLNLPTTPTASGIDGFSLRLMESVAMLRSPWSFATQVQEHTGQLWACDVSIAPCQRAKAEPWVGFLESLKGPVGTFLMGDPWGKNPRGTATGTPLVNGGSQTGETLLTKGWTINITGILKAGDYIQIGQRLYKVKQDANSDGSGNATLEIRPRLRESPANNTSIITASPKGLFRLNSVEVPLFDLDIERIYSIAFTAVEAI